MSHSGARGLRWDVGARAVPVSSPGEAFGPLFPLFGGGVWRSGRPRRRSLWRIPLTFFLTA